MKISLKWLQDFVDIQDFMNKPEALADLLTKAGLEVENIENKAKDFSFVVVGLILEKDKHPNADKLSLCKVTTGEGVVHQIVCGAQNHKANDRVVVALPGAILPGNFSIKRSEIRGVESGGMLCSEKELALSKESNGIMILPEDAPIGQAFAQYKGLDDITFELKVTPNRADCLSHYGLAREVACLLGRPLKKHAPTFAVSENSSKSEVSLDVRDAELCPRYAGRVVSGVKVGVSPAWLQKRLEMVGLNSINNVVDVTNYVMMELGQPLHAFDLAQLQGKKIIVEKAKPGENFKTLDGTNITLSGEELMIKDADRAVAMAGVVGGQNSGVSESTQNIFVESAFFLPSTVRKSARKHGINTDSGYRFSRGVDPDNTGRAMDRAIELILQVAGGVAYGDPYDVYPAPIKKQPVQIALKTVTDRLGYAADGKLFSDFMTRLGCKIESRGDNEFQVLPPTYRFDLETDMDLVEEYARLHGYEHIPDAVPKSELLPTQQDVTFLSMDQASRLIRAQGFQQAMNLAFASAVQEKQFLGQLENLVKTGLNVGVKPVGLLNPLSDDLNVMRSSLSWGLFKNLSYNFHQGNAVGRLFEIGKSFQCKSEGDYQESWRWSLLAWGHETNLWNKDEAQPIVMEVKSAVEKCLQGFQISSYRWLAFANKSEVPSFLHQGQAAILEVEGKKIGFVGTLHPVLLDKEKIRVPAAVAELDFEVLVKSYGRTKRFESLAKFPVVERDLSLVMPMALAAGDVVTEIKKSGGVHLLSVAIFDQYAGDKLEAGKKSVSFRLRFQDKNATLQDEVVSQTVDQVLKALGQKYSIQVR